MGQVMVNEINNKLDKLTDKKVKEQQEDGGEEQKAQKKHVSYSETAIKTECKYKNCYVYICFTNSLGLL